MPEKWSNLYTTQCRGCRAESAATSWTSSDHVPYTGVIGANFAISEVWVVPKSERMPVALAESSMKTSIRCCTMKSNP